MTNDYAGVVLLTGPLNEDTVKLIEDMQRTITELKAELETSDCIIANYRSVMEAIPACRLHGSTCVPHALEWIHTVVTFADVITDKPKSLFHK